MKKNMGIAGRTLRILAALIIAVLCFTKIISGTLGIILLVLTGIFLVTSLIRLCPVYLPFGLKTLRRYK